MVSTLGVESLNYHHLLYFWTVVREGTVARAAERLHLAQPTVSSQLKKLERAIGAPLFERSGRRLQLTETGQLVNRYADEIFSLGRELADALQGRPTGQPLRFTIGVPDVLPKLIVYRLLRPAFLMPAPVHLVCREGKQNDLLTRLATHELDLVLSDVPAASGTSVRVFSHLLGQCAVSFFGAPSMASRCRRRFPESLAETPLLLPPSGTSLRRMLDQWFDEQELHPQVYAEFEDGALLKVFGQEGLGLFPAPAALRNEIERQYRVRLIGTIDDLQERFYAISAERRLKHPAVLAITDAARKELFL